MRHIHCKLLLAFATFLFTLLACASERGIAELQLDGMPSMDLTTAIKDEINVKNESFSQSYFDDCPMLKPKFVQEINVYLRENKRVLGGL